MKGYQCDWCDTYGTEDEVNPIDPRTGERSKRRCPYCDRYDRFSIQWTEIEITEDMKTRRCMFGRRKHQWRHRKTRGPLNLKSHGDEECMWCRKTFREVTTAQKSVLKHKTRTQP